jgi:hypothetical protein
MSELLASVLGYPPLEGGHATITHVAWGAGLPIDSTRARILDRSLPPLPPPVGKLGKRLLYSDTDIQEWIASLPAWREGLTARRAAEREEARARQQWALDQLRDRVLAQYAKPERIA